jgi:Flp pilus assembly protein TadD
MMNKTMLLAVLAVLVLAFMGPAACWVYGPVHPQARLLNRAGAIHLRAGRLVEAQAALGLSLEYSPCYAQALHNLALLESLRGRLQRAEGFEFAALECRPDLVQAINGLGVLALRRGAISQAREWFEQALAVDPGCLDARRNLILIARRNGDLQTLVRQQKKLEALMSPAGLPPAGQGEGG